MATRSSILAWEISQTEETGGLQSMGAQSQTRLSDWAHTHRIAGLVLIWLLFAWCVYIYIYFFSLFTFKHFMSLNLRCMLYVGHDIGPYFPFWCFVLNPIKQFLTSDQSVWSIFLTDLLIWLNLFLPFYYLLSFVRVLFVPLFFRYGFFSVKLS